MFIGLALSLSNPSGVAGPAEWAGLTPLADWDPDDAVLSGSTIVTVPDASGNGYTLTGAVGNEPTIVTADANFNGHDTMDFAILSSQRATFPDVGYTSGLLSAVIVCRSTKVTTGYAISLSNEDYGAYNNTGSGTWGSFLSADATAIQSAAVSPTVPSILLSTVSGGTQRFYRNSATEAGNAASNGVAAASGGVVGNYANTFSVFGLVGQVARVILFGSLLSSGERAAVMAALGTKYGITIV